MGEQMNRKQMEREFFGSFDPANDPANDGTAGHSKGNWRISGEMTIDGYDNICSIARGTLQSVSSANQRLITLAQSAPHDCGDPECPGVVNKRKLELYDRFQVAINEFAKAGLLA